jgi:hypothetical protein
MLILIVLDQGPSLLVWNVQKIAIKRLVHNSSVRIVSEPDTSNCHPVAICSHFSLVLVFLLSTYTLSMIHTPSPACAIWVVWGAPAPIFTSCNAERRQNASCHTSLVPFCLSFYFTQLLFLTTTSSKPCTQTTWSTLNKYFWVLRGLYRVASCYALCCVQSVDLFFVQRRCLVSKSSCRFATNEFDLS